MAKRNHRLLSALLAAMLLSSSMVTASAATVGATGSGSGSLAKYYSTNGMGIGKEATITIDGDASDWNESMKIAQGAAWDIANHWKGGHENCVLDTYALYAAWDDSNLYIGWQMVNTTDTWANQGDGPLSDGGRVLDVPLIIALSTNPNSQGMTGRVKDGKGIWGVDLEFETHVDTLLYMSGKPGLGTPGFFKAADSTGAVDYLDKTSCQTFKDTGVEYKLATTNINSEIWGLNNSEAPADVRDNGADWVDYAKTNHDTKYDSFYEAKIPFSALGITKDSLVKNGIGAMVVASRGESGLDCVPFDMTMIDNATGDYSSDPSTSAEKNDKDTITVPLASIGNGKITPPDSDTIKQTDSEKKQTDSEKTTDTSVDSDIDLGSGVSNVSATAKKGQNVTVTLSASGLKNVMGISNEFTYDTAKYKLVKAEAAYDGVQVNGSTAGTVKWNANLGNGSAGVNLTSSTALVNITLQALTDTTGVCGTNTVRDCYDYNFSSLSLDCISGSAKVSGTSSDTDVADPSEIKVSAKASKGDTVKVTFKGDLSKIEGVSNTFTYDTSALDFVGVASKLDRVETKQSTGSINWNYMGVDGSGATDIVTFEFKAIKNLNGNVGTNKVKEIYDANSKDVDPSALTAKTTVTGGEINTDIDSDATKINFTAKKGDRVVVSFKAKGAANAAGIQEVVDFNSGALKFENAASSVGTINADASNGRVAWNLLFDMGSNAKGADLTSETEIAVLSFTALTDIAASDDVLGFMVKDFYDVNDKAFTSASTSASASVADVGTGKIPVTAKKGNFVKVYCKAVDAEKALGIVEQIDYDAAALKYIGYKDAMGHFDVNSAAGKLRWSIMFDAKGTDLTADDDLVVFTFYAAKDIASTDKVLSFTVEEFYSVDMTDFASAKSTMAYATASASDPDYTISDIKDIIGEDSDSDPSVVITDPDTDTTKKNTVTIMFGDVDDDATVTSQDAVLVLRRSADLEVFDEVKEQAADVDADGKVDSGDSLSVLRFSVNLSGAARTGKTAEITIKFN